VTDASAQEARSRDSAGVRIIEHSARRDAPVSFTLGDKPLLEVGGTEANRGDEFDHSQGYLRGVRLSNGGLAVIDVSRVHFFDATGKRLRIVGRMGVGPEQFQYIMAICRTRGDTLIVDDSHNRRLSVMDGDGRVVRSIIRENSNPPFSFCLDDGTFILLQSIGDMNARQYRITRLHNNGSIVNVVGTVDLPALDFVTMVSPTFAASGNAVYQADPFKSEIREYDSSGTLRRVVRTADKGDSITNAEAEERMAMTIPRDVTEPERTNRMERMRARPRASHWPVLRDLQIDPDGTIWIQDFSKDLRSPDGWTAIDSAGRMVGRLLIPAAAEGTIRSQVISFGRDYVMLRRFTPQRTTSLAVYPLMRSR
jgi:hypothetical protein